jgi:peptidoglycan/LPS O-acetylase OafA/YrhL
LITYLSITLALCIGYPLDHGYAIFFFHLIEFSFGMTWAFIIYHQPKTIHKLKWHTLLLIGVFFYMMSYVMIINSIFIYVRYYNDIFTAIGVFLILLPMCQLIVKVAPRITRQLNYIGTASYLMYLIHGPIIIYLLKPVIGNYVKNYINSANMLIIGCLYCLVTLFLAKLIGPLIDNLSLFLQQAFRMRQIEG